MLLENFKIVDSIAIEFTGTFLDLHSNFDFVKLAYNIEERTVELDWKKCSGEWAKLEQYKKLKLVFKSVDIFRVNPRDSEKPFSEDDCLSYIGYLHPDDLNLMEGFLPSEQSEDNYHMVLGFESGLVLKIYSELVLLVAVNDATHN
ncbi:hypothetical protein FM037_20765 [Shewanella psychropiezotolerans]|uniref:Uncharacterized protein n=1 Tax=Shewanella psychropiezotolerans TaxID=2593655 RepID=A0ABX5X1K4_9GAMM|nr:hypothetical protein [Shewanella psychropiezotolerans]QDO85226.1 hypothetical protein FM037_20765 [Shewanella psychropiezotolerans]